MEYLICLVALLLPGALSMTIVELNQARHLQTDVDMGRPIEHIFEAFKHVHYKQYINEIEENIRRKIFETNVKLIQEHNKKYAKGEKSFYLGVNHLSDLTHNEFLHMYTGHLKAVGNITASTYLSPDNVLLPESVDWRDHGYVTPVKDQGHVCGSCWAFSTTGSLEGQHFKKINKLISFSEQQLVDCSGEFGNNGCHGGFMDQAFEYIKSAGGIMDEQDYPYTAKDGVCTFVVKKEKATVTGFVDLPKGDEAKLQEAVATIGPVSIGIDSSHPSFQSYAGGVYDEPACNSSSLHHGVLVVGYGTDTLPYWLVKNSWGIGWGEAGYIRMRRNNNNQCGVATLPSYPLV